MKIDVNEINQNYIIRLVILALFMYKDMRNQEDQYQEYVRSFVEKRLQYSTNIILDVGPKMCKKESRDLIISDILDEVDDDDRGVNNLVVAVFKAGVEEINLQINLNQEEKYESYLYS